MSAAHQECLRKVFLVMFSGDARILGRNIFMEWSQHLAELRKDKVNQARVLAMLADSDERLLACSTFGAWMQMMLDKRQKRRGHAKILATFAGGVARATLARVFSAFVQVRAEAMRLLHQQQLEDCRVESNNTQAGRMRTIISRMFAGDSEVVLHIVFIA